jgi:hypothetical protein
MGDTPAEIDELTRANDCDWSNVEPSIFGTLFERTLDPASARRSAPTTLARMTSDDILTLLEPVVMAPLRREWEEVKAKSEELRLKVQQVARRTDGRKTGKDSKARQRYNKLFRDFGHRLEEVKVLDPACGSGNFLYSSPYIVRAVTWPGASGRPDAAFRCHSSTVTCL